MRDFDDAWHAQWWGDMEAVGGNIIAAMRMRVVERSAESVVLSMPLGPGVRQGTGVFAAGALIQLADVCATMACFEAWGATAENQVPFPLSIQISVNLLRNTNQGHATAESRIMHHGRTLTVVESKVRGDDGRLLCVVTSTHVPSPQREPK